jgi:hypothetical protein
MASEQFTINDADFMAPLVQRRGTPRAKMAVRARIVHREPGNRRLELFLTEPVMGAASWTLGGHVDVRLGTTQETFNTVLLRPAHRGLRAVKNGRTSSTARIVVTGANLARGICAPVRSVPYEIMGSVIAVHLPADWFPQRSEAVAAGVASDHLVRAEQGRK